MEKQFFVGTNGQEVQQSDYGTLGETGALADDRTLAELLRTAPYSGGTVAKAILPNHTKGVVSANGGTGSVLVYPFRGIIGSRSDSTTDNKKNWQDIRSAIFLGSSPGTLPATQAIASNASGNPRWDLIYAIVAIDTNDTAVTRYVKDTGTLVIGPQSIAVTKSTKVTIAVVAGTPGASPVQPALPADAGSNYNIPLAYVRVPNGFGGGSTVGVNDIYEVAPIAQLSRATGAMTCQPANQLFKSGGSLFTRIPWPASGTRPAPYLAPTMVGAESRIIGLQLGNALTKSVLTGDTIDDSVDWRNRAFRWDVMVIQGSTSTLAWGQVGAPNDFGAPNANSQVYGTNYLSGVGQSFHENSDSRRRVALIADTNLTNLGAASEVVLYVDSASGALKVLIVGSPNAQIFFWVDASAPFSNA